MTKESIAKMLGNKNAVGSKRSPETRDKMRMARLAYVASRKSAIEAAKTPAELAAVIPDALKAKR